MRQREPVRPDEPRAAEGLGDLLDSGVRLEWEGTEVARLHSDRRVSAWILSAIGSLTVAGVGTLAVVERVSLPLLAAAAAGLGLLLMMWIRFPPWNELQVVEIDKREQTLRRSVGRRRAVTARIGPFAHLCLRTVLQPKGQRMHVLRLSGAEQTRQLCWGRSERQITAIGVSLAQWLEVPMDIDPVLAREGFGAFGFEVPHARRSPRTAP